MGKELLMAVKDGYTRETKKRKELGEEEKLEWPRQVDKLVLKYSQRYEFENCYVYPSLKMFDSIVKRTCSLANRAVE